MKKLLLLLPFAAAQLLHGQGAKVKPKDLKGLVGCWTGSLTYLDYSSNASYSMPADLVVTASGSPDAWLCANVYPDEPDANSADTLRLTDKGRKLNGETVTARRRTPDGALEIVTEQAGTDGNEDQKATMRRTYTLGNGKYACRKEVRFEGKAEWILRHEYAYSSKPCE